MLIFLKTACPYCGRLCAGLHGVKVHIGHCHEKIGIDDAFRLMKI